MPRMSGAPDGPVPTVSPVQPPTVVRQIDTRRDLVRKYMGALMSHEPTQIWRAVRDELIRREYQRAAADPAYEIKKVRVGRVTIKDDIAVIEAEIEQWSGALMRGSWLREVKHMIESGRREIDVMRKELLRLSKYSDRDADPERDDHEERVDKYAGRFAGRIAYLSMAISRKEEHITAMVHNYPAYLQLVDMRRELQASKAAAALGSAGNAAPPAEPDAADAPPLPPPPPPEGGT